MKWSQRLLLAAILLAMVVTFARLDWGQGTSSSAPGRLSTSCAAVTTAAACSSFASFLIDKGSLPVHVSWQTIMGGTGSFSVVAVNLEGSLDGTTWGTLDSSSSTSGEMKFVTDKPVMFVRCNPGTLTVSSGAPTFTCQFLLTK